MKKDWPIKHPRASQPDPSILERAAAALSCSDQGAAPWSVGSRLLRKDSTLFEIGFRAPSGVIRAYYKQFHCPVTGTAAYAWTSTISGGLARSQRLTEQVNARCSGRGARLARILAADATQLVCVTEAVKGIPFGQVIGNRMMRHAVTAGQRSRLRRIAHETGRAVCHLEACSGSHASPEDYFQRIQIPALIERVRGMGRLSTEEVASIGERFDELQMAAKDGEGVVFAHCDLAPQNMLFEHGMVGIYDCEFRPRPRGFDVAHLAFRLEYQTVVAWWAKTLIDSLLEGYGDPDVTRSPGWHLARLWLSLRFLRNDRWSRKSLAEVRASL